MAMPKFATSTLPGDTEGVPTPSVVGEEGVLAEAQPGNYFPRKMGGRDAFLSSAGRSQVCPW